MISKKQIRFIIKALLLAAFVGSVFLMFYCIFNQEWNAVAASLAVIATLVSTFSMQQVNWRQEDALEPDVKVFFGNANPTRANLYIQNIGGSSAYDVKIILDKPLRGKYGYEEKPYIAHLPQGELKEILVIVSEIRHHTGKILFKTANNNKLFIEKPFSIMLEVD